MSAQEGKARRYDIRTRIVYLFVVERFTRDGKTLTRSRRIYNHLPGLDDTIIARMCSIQDEADGDDYGVCLGIQDKIQCWSTSILCHITFTEDQSVYFGYASHCVVSIKIAPLAAPLMLLCRENT